MVVDSEFEIGQEVYLATDVDQFKRIIICINISNSGIEYKLGCGSNNSWHYDFEISKEVDVLISVNN